MKFSVVRGLAVGALALSATACNGVERDEAGQITEDADLDAFLLRTGDCFQLPDGTVIETVSAVPCTDAHDSQAYKLFDISGFDALPSGSEMEEIVIDGCFGDSFEAFVGIPYMESSLEVTWFEPTAESWSRFDDREIVCIVTSETGELTFDAKNSGI